MASDTKDTNKMAVGLLSDRISDMERTMCKKLDKIGNDLNAVIMSHETCRTRVESYVKTSADRIKSIEHLVYGNTEPGLKGDVAALKRAAANLKTILAAICAPILALWGLKFWNIFSK